VTGIDAGEIYSLLRLISVPGLGPLRLQALLRHFGSAAGILQARVPDLVGVRGINKGLAGSIHGHDGRVFADEQLAWCEKTGTRILSFLDNEYPDQLRAIPDPPQILFVQGRLSREDGASLGVVGMRRPSPYGEAAAEKITRDLTRAGITIVSGLARGIDTIAHRVCLGAGGRTLAVLGSGLDHIYPPENRGLARRVAASGAVMTEMPFGTKPDAGNFPRRNRIVSGLSWAILVVEAGEVSGALLTATIALDQNRDVFAVPGSILNLKSMGCNRLIQDGAKLVQRAEDILEELPETLAVLRREPSDAAAAPAASLSPGELSILEILKEDPLHIDMIVQQTGLSAGQALTSLLSLELKALVRQKAGALFVRNQ
jgi:DNA processing protein